MNKFTKIGATIGPACADRSTIESMIKAGMNFARLNFAHGTYEWYEKTIKIIRECSEQLNEPISILQDLQGPRIRIGKLPEEGVVVKVGDMVVLDTQVSVFENHVIPLDQPDLHKFLFPGERFLIDDGRIELNIKKVEGTKIHAEVIEAGKIMSNKGINLPDSKLNIDPFSEKDRNDLEFGIRNGIDLVGLSFVSSAEEIRKVRDFIVNYAKKNKIKLEAPVMIIAKIERHEAVKNILEIINEADGIMVARGDLGLELPKQDVPIIQKKIIDYGRKAAKPVIVATQLLDSMRENRRPTRAEVSDVANAVIDHTDALLLTNETAAGKFPVQVVSTMAEIILATERSVYDDLPMPKLSDSISSEQAICKVARMLTEEIRADLILAASLTGMTGRLLSHVRPVKPVYVVTNGEVVSRQLNLSWGIKPFILPFCNTIEEFVENSIKYLKGKDLIKKGDKIVVVAGEPMGVPGNVNLIEIRNIK